LLTVEVLASLYAGYRNPEDRVTASQLSAIINGLATILRFALIDPQRSVMTDDVIEGRVTVRPSDVRRVDIHQPVRWDTAGAVPIRPLGYGHCVGREPRLFLRTLAPSPRAVRGRCSLHENH
jgi:hypothetical protein